jgi:hypothetical protein
MISRCCWCGGKLALPYFATVTDPLGNEHPVHKVCLKNAEPAQKRVMFEDRIAPGQAGDLWLL